MPNLPIHRILDANLNRATEGIRTIEEAVRLALPNQETLLSQFKNLRYQLLEARQQLDLQSLLSARDIPQDRGKALYLPAEGRRESISHIVAAAFKRTEEALRVLEEYSKRVAPPLGKRFKKIRFDIYDLEQRVIAIFSKKEKLDFTLYGVTDSAALGERSHIEGVRQAIAGGVKIIQYRDKHATRSAYYQNALAIRKLTRKHGVTFMVNDYADIAAAIDADGVHLGQEDEPVWVARKVLGPFKLMGVSTHSLRQAIRAEKDGADYMSVGPIFTTPSKPLNRPLGVEVLKAIKNRVKIPIVAIGGINSYNVQDVIRGGVRRVAVIRAVVGAEDITRAAKQLIRKIKQYDR